VQRSLDKVQISVAFFLSGAAALIYQVCWQRLLFVAIGVDIESVTIVVSTFMLGLGLGALLGGWLADRFPRRILLIFCLFELSIAVFGLLSVDLILAMGAAFSSVSRFSAGFLCFLILLLPTMCMGATLPMLIANAVKESRNIGMSTGSLYFINTLGASLGAFAIGFVLFYWLDLRHNVAIAATANLIASAIVAISLIRK
jgi:MFS family permease